MKTKSILVLLTVALSLGSCSMLNSADSTQASTSSKERGADSKQVATETKPAETKPIETRANETKPAETKPV